ncbi:reverse transcriptase domain-containing protein [Tanacetum coccineum]
MQISQKISNEEITLQNRGTISTKVRLSTSRLHQHSNRPELHQGSAPADTNKTCVKNNFERYVTAKETRNPNPEPNVAPVIPPVPKASIPFPSRRNDERRKEKANDQIEKFYEIFRDLSFEISFTDALMLMPKFATTLKTLIGNKEKLSELARTPLNENCSAVILNKLPKKLGDPGRFLIPCEFTGITTCNALADLGASINLMPYSVWKSLSLPELTPTCMTLELADRSITEPIGIAKDVRLMVGKFQFPADFVVVDFEPDPRVPLILGRCFLKTSHALIDVYEGEITLRVGKEAITFNLDQTSKYTADYDHMTANKIDVIEMACDDEHRLPFPNHEQYMPGCRKNSKLCEAKSVETSVMTSQVESRNCHPILLRSIRRISEECPHAKPVIKHHKEYLKIISLQQRFPKKSFSKVHKKNVSKQGRNKAKGESEVHRDPLFDEMPEDKIDQMETENAQSEGRTREMVDEVKEFDEDRLSTEDGVSTVKEKVSTDFEKVSTDSQKVSTDESKVSTDEQVEGTEQTNEGSEEIFEGTEDQTKEEIASQTSTQTPTSMTFGDDETIATLLINMSKAKAASKEKEKGVELKDVEEFDRPRPTSTRSLLTLKPLLNIDPKDKGKKKIEEEDESESEDDDIPQAVKKFKQLESDEELARKIQEEWEAEEERNKIAEEKATNEALIKNFDDIKARIEADRILAEKLQEQEREQFTIEERAKFLHDTIAAQRKFLAQQRSEAIRNRPPTKNQLRNQMMTYLKHVGNFKHSELKSKKFEDIQAMYEKIKRSDEDFIAIGSVEDDRLIKKMKKKDSSKGEEIKQESKEEVKEEDKGEENTRKRKHGTRKKMKSRKRRFKQDTSQDDPSDIEKENDELRLCLTIAPDEDKEVDYEILDKKYPIIDWKTENLGTKPQFDESKRSEEINMNVVTRSNGQKRSFSTLMRVLSVFDREDLDVVYKLVMCGISYIITRGRFLDRASF